MMMEHLTRQYIEKKLSQYQRTVLSPEEHRKACVMVTLIDMKGRLHLLLTKRTDTVEHHKGQISFPGGMVDENDETETATALREVEEEIGIPGSAISVLGMLDDIHIPSGFVVTPIVGYLEHPLELNISPEEVAEVLLVPFEKFFDPSLRRLETRELRGIRRQVYCYDVWQEPVWGATAHIIKQLTDLLSS